MTPNEWRIEEIKTLVDTVTTDLYASDSQAWFALGRIYAVVTTPDRDIEKILAEPESGS